MGAVSGDAYLIRLTPDGAADPSFAAGGVAVYDFGLRDRFIAATQDASGRLVLVGHQETHDGFKDRLVARMAGDGVLDPDFGHGGYLLEFRVDEGQHVEIDSGGRIVVGGNTVDGLSDWIQLTRHIGG